MHNTDDSSVRGPCEILLNNFIPNYIFEAALGNLL